MATMAISGQEMELQRRAAEREDTLSARRAKSVAERNRELFEQQHSRRRGPTPEMFFAKYIDNTRLKKEDDPDRRREMMSFTVVMTVFFALTMVYVWQHFSAIEVGYNVEAQKKQVEQLREENRQLHLTYAELSDPNRIDALARQLGLQRPTPGQVVRQDAAMQDGAVLAQAQAPIIPASQRTAN
jgi:cell division protein FtsL